MSDAFERVQKIIVDLLGVDAEKVSQEARFALAMRRALVSDW